jgi:hypothetical protein
MMDNNRLIDVILDNIDYSEYKLKNDEKKWIYKFINESNDTFIELDTDLKTITEDTYIKIDDIPTIIKIISDTYYSGLVKKFNTFDSNNLYVYIKYNILVILDTELLVLNKNVNKERLNSIIGSSMDLLNMNLSNNIVNDNNYCSCFYNHSFLNFDSIKNFCKKGFYLKQLKNY